MKGIWFTRIRYDRGRHFSGDSGAAVWVDEIRSDVWDFTTLGLTVSHGLLSHLELDSVARFNVTR